MVRISPKYIKYSLIRINTFLYQEFHKNNKEQKEQSKALEKEHNKQERQLIIEGKKPFYFSKGMYVMYIYTTVYY